MNNITPERNFPGIWDEKKIEEIMKLNSDFVLALTGT
jgi:hypothetical protein